MKKALIAALVIGFIAGAIIFIESQKPDISDVDIEASVISNMQDMPDKERKYERARDLVNPNGFLNTDPFSIADYIGEKVIMVDFWTYSCINCQRTLPYLNAWHEKYRDEGLLIIGVHTPEFEFEGKRENLEQAIDRFDIEYPIVMDNNYSTWRAYGNRYWPRKYLIDIDGYIVYDHIGEGAYDETEEKIQELLKERANKLGMQDDISSGIVQPENTETATRSLKTPEIYFGADRNDDSLANGVSGMRQTRTFDMTDEIPLDKFALEGEWKINGEYVTNLSKGAKIKLRYRAEKVFMVAGSEKPVRAQVLIDGKPIGNKAGLSVDENGYVTIQEETLYRIVEDNFYGQHTLELIFEDEGVNAFTFTFG